MGKILAEQKRNFAGIEAGETKIQAAAHTAQGLRDEGNRTLAALSSMWGGNASESYQAVQLKSAATILALLRRHRDDARLENLFDNLWRSRGACKRECFWRHFETPLFDDCYQSFRHRHAASGYPAITPRFS